MNCNKCHGRGWRYAIILDAEEVNNVDPQNLAWRKARLFCECDQGRELAVGVGITLTLGHEPSS